MDRNAFIMGFMLGAMLTTVLCMIIVVSNLPTTPVPDLEPEQAGEP